MPVERTHLSLVEAESRFGMTQGDILNLSTQRKLRLLVAAPDYTDVVVRLEDSGKNLEPFLMAPQLLVLPQSACLKVQMSGGTTLSDFPLGFYLDSKGKFVEISPSYGRPELLRVPCSWRLISDGKVVLAELLANKLFVLVADLKAYLGEPASSGTTYEPSSPKESTSETPPAPPPPMPESTEREGEERVKRQANGDNAGTDIPASSSEQLPDPGREQSKAAAAELDPPVTTASPVDVLLKLKAVIERTGLSQTTIYNKLKPTSKQFDATFPQRVWVGEYSVRWHSTEIDAWVASRSRLSNEAAHKPVRRTARKKSNPATPQK